MKIRREIVAKSTMPNYIHVQYRGVFRDFVRFIKGYRGKKPQGQPFNDFVAEKSHYVYQFLKFVYSLTDFDED